MTYQLRVDSCLEDRGPEGNAKSMQGDRSDVAVKAGEDSDGQWRRSQSSQRNVIKPRDRSFGLGEAKVKQSPGDRCSAWKTKTNGKNDSIDRPRRMEPRRAMSRNERRVLPLDDAHDRSEWVIRPTPKRKPENPGGPSGLEVTEKSTSSEETFTHNAFVKHLARNGPRVREG